MNKLNYIQTMSDIGSKSMRNAEAFIHNEKENIQQFLMQTRTYLESCLQFQDIKTEVGYARQSAGDAKEILDTIIHDIAWKTQNTIEHIDQKLIPQFLQRLYEHAPYTYLWDVYREKGLISKTPIPRGSRGYKGRLLWTIPQSVILGEVVINGKQIVDEAQANILDIRNGNLPENIDANMLILMLSLAISMAIYWGIIKGADMAQELKIAETQKETNKEQNVATIES